MSTRGYLIFKYNGVYNVIYNHFDSYASGMGAANVKVLKILCKDFNGNVALVRQHLRTLFDALVARSLHSDAYDENGNLSSNYVRIWEKTSYGFNIADMADSRSVVGFEEVCSKNEPPESNFEIEYKWEVDLDAGRFGMGTESTVRTYWSWKALYLMTADDWLEEAETHLRYWDEGYEISI